MSERIVILGGGESGTGAAVLARRSGLYGNNIFISDSGKIKDKYKEVISAHAIEYEENGHSSEKILNASEVIKSPGIPEESTLIRSLKDNGIPVISDIEFAGRFTRAKKICITGSNGKTTTTLLIYHIMKRAGCKVSIAGNVGKSFAMAVAENYEDDPDYYVLEISSFQLDNMYSFKADIAILMNITPDHLDRYHHKFQDYIDSKFRILQNQTNNDLFIYCADDKVITGEMNKLQPVSRLVPFSLTDQFTEGAFVKDNAIVIKYNNQIFSMIIDELSLKGQHNVYNSMAAASTACALNIRKETIRECLTDFQGVEHRLEPVLQIHGIMFINDSKATNINSTWYALESMKTKVIWIVGGIDKGNDYAMLSDLVRQKVKAIVCLGVDNSRIHEAFDGMGITIADTKSMKEAVRSSYYLAKNGDTVLLSPACASFDLFENYEDRGKQFKLYVREL
ncbi:MAG: UDP-N-acetylmuramoyl-L-alanine--D-glutamate ligase [Bacteroidia bacterium]|nr:UDP-N-acetylmuramoyl-L-alanine--D-glutamate ligase [Bacteroidia bacterium]